MAKTKKTRDAGGGWSITFNAPITLTFILICLLVFAADMLTGKSVVRDIFSCYSTSASDPMQYVRLFTHVFGHADWDHFFSNALFILIIAPMLEEKYGSWRLVTLFAITALATGLFLVIFTPDIRMMGASGVVFAVILLASCANLSQRRIPITLILVLFCYVGREVVYLIMNENDGIARMAHIIGGVVGAAYGLTSANRKAPPPPPPPETSISNLYQGYMDKFNVK